MDANEACRIVGCYESYADKPPGHKSHSAKALQQYAAKPAITIPAYSLTGEAPYKLDPVPHYDSAVIMGCKGS
jgi:hypothetical protein